MAVEKSHMCTHLQNLPEWKLQYEAITIKDTVFNMFFLLCAKCAIDKKPGKGWHVVKYPLSMPNAEKRRLETKVPF